MEVVEPRRALVSLPRVLLYTHDDYCLAVAIVVSFFVARAVVPVLLTRLVGPIAVVVVTIRLCGLPYIGLRRRLLRRSWPV